MPLLQLWHISCHYKVRNMSVLHFLCLYACPKSQLLFCFFFFIWAFPALSQTAKNRELFLPFGAVRVGLCATTRSLRCFVPLRTAPIVAWLQSLTQSSLLTCLLISSFSCSIIPFIQYLILFLHIQCYMSYWFNVLVFNVLYTHIVWQ